MALLLILFQLFLQPPIALLLLPEKSVNPSFSFPRNMDQGTIYRLADHTRFGWDRLEVHFGSSSELAAIHNAIKEINPDFSILGKAEMVLVFYKDGAIVYAMKDRSQTIRNPQAEAMPWGLEFTREEAVFIVGNRELWGYVLIPCNLLQDPDAFLSTVKKRVNPSFSFPRNMEPGTIYRLADHTNFEWDKLGVYLGFSDKLVEAYYTIREDNPGFSIFRDIPMVLVFYKDGAIVYAMVDGERKIWDPQAESVPWELEFTREEAVFTAREVRGPERYYLIPYSP